MGHSTPPDFPLKLLKWFCKPEYHPDIEGDLLELYDRRVGTTSLRKARWLLLKDVLLLFRPGIIRPIHLFKSVKPNFMLRENLKIVRRQMLKQKGFTAIKIGGFAMGVTACLLIALFIRDELSYDQHYPDADRIFRIYADYNIEGEILGGTSFPAAMTNTILQKFPEVEAVARVTSFSTLDGPGSNQLRRADQQQNTYEEGFAYADQGILDMLQPTMLYGDVATALSSPGSIVITEEKANKYFPNEDPIGKSIILNDRVDRPFVISGVLADTPTRSHLQLDFYLSLAGHEFWPGEQSQWMSYFYDCYLKLKPNTEVAAFEKKLELISRNYFGQTMVKNGSAESVDDFIARFRLRLQPITDLYLMSTVDNIRDGYTHGDIRMVWLFGTIAFFVLLLAAVNFINLSTAKASSRAKEVGVRKVLGSARTYLINQFLTESLLYTFFAVLLGVLAAYVLLPFFNQMAAKSITFPWGALWFLPSLLVATLVIGLLAGLYPAFYLSGFEPIETIKGKMAKGQKRQGLQNRLIVFQFTTTIILIVGTITIHRQMNFILNKDVGFDKDQIVLLQGIQTIGDKIPTLKERLQQMPEVKAVSVSDFIPVQGGKRSGYPMWVEGRKELDPSVLAQQWKVDEDYLKTMGFKLIAGRDFNRDMPTDRQSTIINRRMAQKMNLENPVGTAISYGGPEPYTIIGVVEDFHFESFKYEISPLYLVLGDSPETISIKVSSDDVSAVLPGLISIWDQFSPNQPIRYNFLDDRFAASYEDVRRTEWIFSSFSLLAIVLACLGLFALAIFMAEQRMKEMSIRKVLGASVLNIFQLLTRNFLLLIIISFGLAAPLAWYLMKRWLEDYHYRVPLTSDVFAYAGIAVALIALLTISYQALRTATVNPAEVMRKE